jgi:hypothetical protein
MSHVRIVGAWSEAGLLDSLSACCVNYPKVLRAVPDPAVSVAAQQQIHKCALADISPSCSGSYLSDDMYYTIM